MESILSHPNQVAILPRINNFISLNGEKERQQTVGCRVLTVTTNAMDCGRRTKTKWFFFCSFEPKFDTFIQYHITTWRGVGLHYYCYFVMWLTSRLLCQSHWYRKSLATQKRSSELRQMCETVIYTHLWRTLIRFTKNIENMTTTDDSWYLNRESATHIKWVI